MPIKIYDQAPSVTTEILNAYKTPNYRVRHSHSLGLGWLIPIFCHNYFNQVKIRQKRGKGRTPNSFLVFYIILMNYDKPFLNPENLYIEKLFRLFSSLELDIPCILGSK